MRSQSFQKEDSQPALPSYDPPTPPLTHIPRSEANPVELELRKEQLEAAQKVPLPAEEDSDDDEEKRARERQAYLKKAESKKLLRTSHSSILLADSNKFLRTIAENSQSFHLGSTPPLGPLLTHLTPPPLIFLRAPRPLLSSPAILLLV